MGTRTSVTLCLELFALSGCLLAMTTPATAAGRLQPPAGYFAAAGSDPNRYDCPALPEPFTAALDFPSKYEGSGKARDQLNEASQAVYRAKARPINELEKGINEVVGSYMETGRPEAAKCALDAYVAWAKAGALKQAATGYTGRSVRKWTLASLSGAWLHLKFSSAQPLRAYPEQTRLVEQWLGSVADQVVSEWNEGSTIDKINNHFYWAAWSVMATAVSLDRRDLFDWSVKMFRIFETQVDEQGFLPNELSRETRALGYHAYAATPLSMIAAFGKANGIDLASEHDGALKRLVAVTLKGIDDPGVFEKRTGKPQETSGSDNQNTSSKLAWLEPYCWAAGCDGTAAIKLARLRPMKNMRLGGNLTQVFGEQPGT